MGSSSPKTTSNLSYGQKQVDLSLYPQIQAMLGQGATPYNGQQQASLLPQFQQMNQLTRQYNPQQFQGQQTSAVLNALSGRPSFDLSPQTTANYFQNSVVTPMMQTWNQQIAPQISEGFAGFSGFSSREGTDKAMQLGNLGTSMASQLSQAQFSNQQLQANLAESAANRQIQGVGLAQQLANQPLNAAGQIAQLYYPFQQRADQGAQLNYQNFLRTTPENSPWLAQAQQYLGHSLTSTYNPGSPLANALSGAGAGATIGNAIFPGFGGLLGGIGGGIAGLF